MSENAQMICQQCNEVRGLEDLKPIYDEEGEIFGHVCNPCRLKTVETARRCHIFDCKTKPDTGPTGFRTLPSKFYDLPEGEVKKRIVKQFGIIKNARACCNMCYVRISKAIVQINIVYGGGVSRQTKASSSKQNLPSSSTQNTSENTKAPQAKDDRLAEYTGPKFTRRSGGFCWNKNRNLSQNENAGEQQQGAKNVEGSTPSTERADVASKARVQKGSEASKNGETVTTSAKSANNPKEDGNKPQICEVKSEESSSLKVDGIVEKKSITYSSTSISPTAMRFRRIQPKLPRFEEYDLSDDIETEVSSPGKQSRKRSTDNEDDDYTWSPGGSTATKEKIELKPKKPKKPVSSEVMSDFVSCMGCRKICSSKEAKPFYDFEKFCGRLCNDCRIKKREENKNCPIKGCNTPTKDVILKPLPPNIHDLKGEARGQLQEMGITEKTKLCCKTCWKNLSNFIASVQEPQTEEQVYTMCRNCCKIVPMQDTVPNFEEDGRQCGVLCKSCFKMHPKGVHSEQKGGQDKPTGGHSDPKVRQSDQKGHKQKKARSAMTSPTINIKFKGTCMVRNCVNAGQEEQVQLVSGKRILRDYLDEKMLRSEFGLDDETDYCCRSCLARIKWFVADIKKREAGGLNSEGKSGNSLKNLTAGVDSQEKHEKPEKSSKTQTKTSSGKIKLPGISKKNQQQNLSLNQIPANSPVSNKTHGKTLGSHLQELAKKQKQLKEESKNDPNTLLVPSSILSSLSPAAFVLPPAIATQVSSPQASISQSSITQGIPTKTAPVSPLKNPPSSHPPVLQVGGQQFVLNVISRCDKEQQTASSSLPIKQKPPAVVDKGVQANIPLMPKFEGTVSKFEGTIPANLPNGKKVKYTEAKEKTRYAVKRQGRDLFEQFLEQLNDISGGCAQQLLLDIYRPKEVIMATNYEKILTSIGTLYRNTDRSNKQERLRLLSTVALHAPNETLKRFFQRLSKRDDLVSVNEAEIVQAREYAKQFGPGTHVMPVGQVTWSDVIARAQTNPSISLTASEDSQGKPKEDPHVTPEASLQDKPERPSPSSVEEEQGKITPSSENSSLLGMIGLEAVVSSFPGGNVDEEAVKKQAELSVVSEPDKMASDSSVPLTQKVEQAKKKPSKKRRRTVSAVSDKVEGSSTDGVVVKKRKKSSVDGSGAEKLKKKNDGSRPAGDKDASADVKEKRTRTAFSNELKDILEKHFQKNIYATKSMVQEISQDVGMDKKKIDNWFRNRRSRLKKDELDKKLKEAAPVQGNIGVRLSESRNASEHEYSSGMSSEETNGDEHGTFYDGDKILENVQNIEADEHEIRNIENEDNNVEKPLGIEDKDNNDGSTDLQAMAPVCDLEKKSLEAQDGEINVKSEVTLRETDESGGNLEEKPGESSGNRNIKEDDTFDIGGSPTVSPIEAENSSSEDKVSGTARSHDTENLNEVEYSVTTDYKSHVEMGNVHNIDLHEAQIPKDTLKLEAADPTEIDASTINITDTTGCGKDLVKREEHFETRPDSIAKPLDEQSYGIERSIASCTRTESEVSSGGLTPVGDVLSGVSTPVEILTGLAAIDRIEPDASFDVPTPVDEPMLVDEEKNVYNPFGYASSSDESEEGSLVIAEDSDGTESESDEEEATTAVRMLQKFDFEQGDSDEKSLVI